MMKITKYAFLFLFGFALLLNQVCAATNNQTGTEEYLDDSVITTKVKAAIFNDPLLKSFDINVETYKGIVQLSGFVSSQALIVKAVHVTSEVKGVKSINNAMQLK